MHPGDNPPGSDPNVIGTGPAATAAADSTLKNHQEL